MLPCPSGTKFLPVRRMERGRDAASTPERTQGIRGTTVPVYLEGQGFVVGATTVTVGGDGVTVANVIVRSAAGLTASLVLDPAAALGARTVTVTTAGGTSGPQIFAVTNGEPV
jgi:hypothetical protein